MTSNVSLESRMKVPQKMMEMLADASTLAQLSKDGSLSSELLISCAKNLAAVEMSIESSMQQLNECDKMLRESFKELDDLRECMESVFDAQERLQEMERHNFYCDLNNENAGEVLSEEENK